MATVKNESQNVVNLLVVTVMDLCAKGAEFTLGLVGAVQQFAKLDRDQLFDLVDEWIDALNKTCKTSHKGTTALHGNRWAPKGYDTRQVYDAYTLVCACLDLAASRVLHGFSVYTDLEIVRFILGYADTHPKALESKKFIWPSVLEAKDAITALVLKNKEAKKECRDRGWNKEADVITVVRQMDRERLYRVIFKGEYDAPTEKGNGKTKEIGKLIDALDSRLAYLIPSAQRDTILALVLALHKGDTSAEGVYNTLCDGVDLAWIEYLNDDHPIRKNTINSKIKENETEIETE